MGIHNFPPAMLIPRRDIDRVIEALVSIQQFSAEAAAILIQRLDAFDGDPEETDAEDSFALPHHALRFAGGAGCAVSDDSEDDDPRESDGDDLDSGNAEDEVPAFNQCRSEGPGCPISDPDDDVTILGGGSGTA